MKKPTKKRYARPPFPVKRGGKTLQQKDIDAVKQHLPSSAEKAVTMRALAKKLRCSKGAAERRLNAFLAQSNKGDKLQSVQVREGERGPTATGFYL